MEDRCLLSTFQVKHSPYLQLGDAPLVGFPGSETDQIQVIWQTVPDSASGNDSFVAEYRRPADPTWTSAGATSTINTGIESRVNHFVNVFGLDYDADYDYRVRHMRDGASIMDYQAMFHTRLPAGSTKPFSFVGYGDSAQNPPTGIIAVQNRINTFDTEFSVLMGDNVYESGTHPEFDNRFDPTKNPPLTQYNASHVEYYGMGNHDIASAGGQPSRDNYAVPVPVAGITSPVNGPSGAPAEHNYSFDYGNVHLLTYDSNGGVTSKANWIVADMQASTARWKVLYFHHPLTDTALMTQLQGAGVDLLLYGHIHDFGRTPSGSQFTEGNQLMQVLGGIGGRTGERGFIKVDVTATRLTVSYIGDDGSVRDTFMINASVANTAPTDIALTNNTIPENSLTGAVVGNLSTTDADVGDSHTYSLTNNAGGRFGISGSQLVVSNGGLLNFEANTSHSVTVRTTDSANASFDKSFTVDVSNVNESPTDLVLVGDAVPEQSPINTLVGNLSTTDPDVGDTHMYMLTDDAGGRFGISGSQLVVADGSLLDTATSCSHQVMIKTTDFGGLPREGSFTIAVTGTNNSGPTDIALSGNTTPENAPDGTVVGMLSTSDTDSCDSHTYSMVDDAGGRFAISGNNLVVADGGLLDFETNDSHSVTVRTTDLGMLNFEKMFTIMVTDQSEVFAVSAGQGGSTPNDEGRAVVVDPAGNSYVAGTLLYADTTSDSTSSRSQNIFVAKYGPDGSLLWQHTIGSTSDDRARGIARDSLGNIYVTGAFSGTIDFDPSGGVTNLTSGGGLDIFVLKLDSNGVFQWARKFGNSGSSDIGYGITVDSLDNVLITGQFSGTFDFDPTANTANLTSAGSSDIFVLKLTGTAGFTWAKRMGGTGSDRGTAITTDSTDRVYTTGNFSGTADFDPSTAVVANLVSAGSTDIFVSRLNSDGTNSYAGRLGGSSSDGGHDIEIDGGGNIYTTGFFSGTADFNPNGLTNNLTSGGGTDVFLSKLDPTGAYLLARRVGGSGDDRGRGLAIESGGAVGLTGHFTGTVDFNPDTAVKNLTSAGSYDAFLLRLNSGGGFLSARKIGGTGSDMGRAIAKDSADSLVVTGFYTGTVTIDTGAGLFPLTSSGGLDIFLAKFPQPQNHAPVLAPIGDKPAAEATPLSITITATDMDLDSLVYSAIGLPTGASLNANTGAFNWIPGESQDGTHTVTFSVSDGTTTDSETIMITVDEVNQPPVLAAIGNKSVQDGNLLSFSISATDSDQVAGVPNTLTYSAIGLPSGADLDPNTGAFNWTPLASQIGTHPVTFSVTDVMTNDSETINIHVGIPLTPVTVSFQDGVSGYTGTRDTRIRSGSATSNFGTGTYVSANGGVGDAALLKWDLSSIPIGSTIESVSFTFNITNATNSIYEIYALKKDWTEDGATWSAFAPNTGWTVAGAKDNADRDPTVLGTLTAPALGLVTIQLNLDGINAVKSWVDNPNANFGIIIQDYLNASDGVGFDSSEVTTVSNRPKLTVTYLA